VVAPDLSQDITWRGTSINTVAESIVDGKPVMIGCLVDAMDLSDIDIVQFREKLALSDGMDVGSVWIGARRIQIRGTVYDKTRGETYSRLATIEDLFLPKPLGSTTATFGYYALQFYTISGANSAPELRTITAMPNGLRYAIDRDAHGRQNQLDNVPLAIQWQVLLYARDPVIAGGVL